VDAIASGKEAAESMHRFINGEDLKEGREKNYDFEKPEIIDVPRMDRVKPEDLPVKSPRGQLQ
jgi:hypothetical protein